MHIKWNNIYEIDVISKPRGLNSYETLLTENKSNTLVEVTVQSPAWLTSHYKHINNNT